MARRLDQYQERLHALSLFGKDLVRRAKSGCELCGASGTGLQIFEVPPVPLEPDFNHCVMVCEACWEQLDKPRTIDANHWRSLSNVLWSETSAVQVLAVGILRLLATDHPWATELLEQLYLTGDIEDWLERLDLG